MAGQDQALLKVRRFRQKPGECSLAMIASIAHFYDNNIDLSVVRDIATHDQRTIGTWTSEQGKLFNDLGFGSVTIVSCDFAIVDWAWSKLKKSTVLDRLRKVYRVSRRRNDDENADRIKDMFEWLSAPDCDNRLVIDDDLPRHIRRTVRSGRPVGAYFNWTGVHRFSRAYKKKFDDIRGEEELHSCVIRGFDEDNIHVVDSHSEKYTGKRAKLRKGYYKIPWNRYLVHSPEGGLVIVR